MVRRLGVIKSCQTCRFWVLVTGQDDPATRGLCRRYPPVATGPEFHPFEEEPDWDFPTVFAENWCGEWQKGEIGVNMPAFSAEAIDVGEFGQYRISNGRPPKKQAVARKVEPSEKRHTKWTRATKKKPKGE